MTIEEDLINLFDKMADDPRFDKYLKPSIDDDCVECCKVVNIAANLQDELDDCRAQNKRLRTTVCDEYRAVDDRDRTIDELKDKNIEDLKELYALDTKRCDKRVEALEAELSARKHDSEVLMKVVNVVGKWNDDTHWDRSVLRGITTIVEEYLDAPEPPIEEEHYIIVDVNSVEDVKPVVEKIAKSVAALTGNHVNARVQFVAQDDDMSAYLELP